MGNDDMAMSNEERDEARNTREKIARIKEKLISKNMNYRAKLSQVNDPERIREVIARKEVQVATLQCGIMELEDVLENGSLYTEVMLNDIEQLEDELRVLENAKQIEKLGKMFSHLVDTGRIAQGIDVDDLMAQIELNVPVLVENVKGSDECAAKFDKRIEGTRVGRRNKMD